MTQKDPNKALEIHTVDKVFIKRKNKQIKAVDQVQFSVGRGEIFGVLGPNGSGKSTLIRMISTLLVPDHGTIEVFGYDSVKEAMMVRKLINRVSAEASFFKKLSAMENLLFTAGLYGIPKPYARKKLMEIFKRVGLPAKRVHDPLEDFSRGMQQKVAIARAFLTTPALLLLDEPTTGLDPRAKKEVQSLILEIQKENQTTVLLTTHDMVEADQLCERVAIIHDGRISAIGTAQDLKMKASRNGSVCTLEEVFMFFTGSQLVQYEDEMIAEVS